MPNNNDVITTSLRQQRGIATILMVVFIGIALIATSLSAMYSVRSTQEKQIAVHAVTHAQTGLWTGVEAFRRYLEDLSTDDLVALHGDAGFDIILNDATGATNAFGNLSVKDITVVKATSGNKYNVQATIGNTHTSAQASAAVGAFFEVVRSGSNPVELAAALDFHDDLNASGGITMTTPSGTYATINVDGSAVFPKINISRMAALNATGAVSLGSAVAADKIHSNSDVTLTGSAKAQTIWSRGAVDVSGGSAGIIWANGDVSYTASGYYSQDSIVTRLTIKSQSTITSTTVGIGDGTRDTFTANGDININRAGGGQLGIYTRLESAGNIIIRNNNASVTSMVAEVDLSCLAGDWTNFDDIQVRGAISDACKSAQDASIVGGSGVTAGDPATDAPFVEEAPLLTLPKPVIDVWTLKQYANYIIEYEGGYTWITTYNVNGFTNGVRYYLGNYAAAQDTPDKMSHLCTAVDTNRLCITPTKDKSLGSICLGSSTNGQCLVHSIVNGRNTFTFDGKAMAPGIYFIDGDVVLGNGTNYATVLAAGNVTTQDQIVQKAVNYGDYAGICDVTGIDVHDTLITTRYSAQHPKNLCDKTAGTYKAIDVGNIGIAAGGYKPGAGGFSGGDITLASNTKVYGLILAGDYLETKGGIEVHGYVTAAVQGGKRALQDNTLGGNTTMVLNSGTANYNPNKIPNMSGGECTGPSCSGAGGQPEEAKLLWSKYL